MSITIVLKKRIFLETKTPNWLSNEEIFAILKVLIEFRAFPKGEMDSLIEKLTQLAKKDEQTIIKQMMANEKYLYVELDHQKELLDTLWLSRENGHSKLVFKAPRQ